MENTKANNEAGSSSHILPFQHAPSFFRIYLPQLYSHKMLIPSDFVKYFNGSIPENVRLKNMQGELWTVKLELINGERVYITDGWEEYRTNHSLVPGDFVVFQPLECYDFFVKVFGPHGSIKDGPVANHGGFDHFAVTNRRRVLATDRGRRTTGARSGAENLQFSKVFREASMRFMSVPKRVLDEYDYKLPQRISLRNENGYAKEIRLRKATNRVVMGYKGITKFWRRNKVKEGDKLDFEVILGKGRKIKEFRFKIQKQEETCLAADDIIGAFEGLVA